MPPKGKSPKGKVAKPWLIKNLETGQTALATAKDSVDPKTGKTVKTFTKVKQDNKGNANN